jgi:Flp pilus assembly protein TadG
VYRRTDVGRRSARRRLWLGIDSRGVALGWISVALVAIIGVAGMAFDLGTLEIAAQRCQEVADGAALGAATELPSGAVRPTALSIVDSNNTDGHGWGVTCSESDVVLYGPGASLGDLTLDANASAVEVTVHGPVEFGFVRLVGLERATAHRKAVAVRGIDGSGYPFVPMWIDRTTADEAEYAPGTTNILMADGPSYEGIPGSFGFLDPGSAGMFRKLLSGAELTEEELNTYVFDTDENVTATTGERVGHWTQDLGGRITAGSTGIYAGDTAESYTVGNPRVIVTALVSYIGGTGDNATFQIDGYVAFFLEDVVNVTGDKAIEATFLDYYIPGDETYGAPTFDGFFSVRLIL